jgi:hypothetical protein
MSLTHHCFIISMKQLQKEWVFAKCRGVYRGGLILPVAGLAPTVYRLLCIVRRILRNQRQLLFLTWQMRVAEAVLPMNSYGPKAISKRASATHAAFFVALRTPSLPDLQRGVKRCAAHLGCGCSIVYFQVPTVVTRTRVLTSERLDLVADVVVQGEPPPPVRAVK